jgi:D-alanyl-lipoteichoic acid acyltransferase DltB (MBOAT superfamily)
MDFVDRFPLLPLAFVFLVYPVFAWIALRLFPERIRVAAFAILNVLGLGAMCWLGGAKEVRVAFVVSYTRAAIAFVAIYLSLALLHFASLRLSKSKAIPWSIVFLLPLVFLVYLKYFGQLLDPFGFLLAPAHLHRFEGFFIGISYLAFRLVLLTQEVRNDAVATPSLSEYLSFAFFVPTLTVGPISRYSLFIASLRKPDRTATPVDQSLLRIAIGFTKYIFLSTLCAQLTYGGLLRDEHPHGWFDVILAILMYPLYLYNNFSGYCDMAIGVSGLLGIKVDENFDRPFQTRNIQEFWTRWHMTLSTWFRDFLFTPLSKALMRRFGIKSANHVIAFSLMATFLVVGAWHGKGWNFVAFGALQGAGLVTVHYYSAWLKQKLGRDGFADYRKNRLIKGAMTVLNFAYFAFTLFFFANTFEQMRSILQFLK